MQNNVRTVLSAESKDLHSEDLNVNTGFTTSGPVPESESMPGAAPGIQMKTKRGRTPKLARIGSRSRKLKSAEIPAGETGPPAEPIKPAADGTVCELPKKGAPGATPGKLKRKAKEKRKYGSFTRRLWSDAEDEAIIKLVKKYGIRKWTLISRKLQEEYEIYGRSGKQCRER